MTTFTIAVLLLTAFSVSAQGNWKVRGTTFFTIYFTGDEKVANRVEWIANDHWQEIQKYVPVNRTERIPIYIYPKRNQFLKAIGEAPQSQIIGVAYSPGSVIRVDGSQLYGFLNEVVSHELVHVALSQALGTDYRELPLWFNEGLARHEEGGVKPADRDTLAEAVANRTLIPLSQLNEHFPKDNDAAALAYAQSASVVEHLINQHGADAVFRIVHMMQDGIPFSRALYEAVGRTQSGLEQDWLQSLRTAHRWDWLDFLYAPIVSAIMVILCTAAWFMMRQRRRRIMARFEEEEFNDFLNRGPKF